MITREEAKDMIEISKRETYPYLIEDNIDEVMDKIYNEFEQHIKSLEAQLANTEQLKNPKIIRKGQTFNDERNGQVTFLGVDSYGGERSIILLCSDGSKKYPLLTNMPEFNFIDN